MTKFKIIGLLLDNGNVCPLGWTDLDVSKKKLKRITHKFRNDSDVVRPIILDWIRLYDTLADMKSKLPRLAE